MPSRVNLITSKTKQRIVYSDITPNINVDPVTGDLVFLQNANAIIQSIQNLVLISPGEIYYHPNIGTTVEKSLFGFADQMTADSIKDSITQTLAAQEPRAQNVQVNVVMNPTQDAVQVYIQFTPVALPGTTVTVPTFVIRLR